ncbi:MAG: hypothetical protein ABSH22_13990, partial [Tepidisphaeraceae bacterium]
HGNNQSATMILLMPGADSENLDDLDKRLLDGGYRLLTRGTTIKVENLEEHPFAMEHIDSIHARVLDGEFQGIEVDVSAFFSESGVEGGSHPTGWRFANDKDLVFCDAPAASK